MGYKRRAFPSTEPLAYHRAGPIAEDRIDAVAHRLRASQEQLSRDALALINDQAAYIVAIENELGQAYEEMKCGSL